MYRIDLQDRETCEMVCEGHVCGFASYEEACDYGNEHEAEWSRNGWMYVVMPI